MACLFVCVSARAYPPLRPKAPTNRRETFNREWMFARTENCAPIYREKRSARALFFAPIRIHACQDLIGGAIRAFPVGVTFPRKSALARKFVIAEWISVQPSAILGCFRAFSFDSTTYACHREIISWNLLPFIQSLRLSCPRRPPQRPVSPRLARGHGPRPLAWLSGRLR